MTDFSALNPAATQATQRSASANMMPQNDAALQKAAQKLEAQFLAQMLTAAGFGEARESFGGGEGESQFSSFLVTEYADAMAEQGGIGLAEMIFERLKDQHATSGI